MRRKDKLDKIDRLVLRLSELGQRNVYLKFCDDQRRRLAKNPRDITGVFINGWTIWHWIPKLEAFTGDLDAMRQDIEQAVIKADAAVDELVKDAAYFGHRPHDCTLKDVYAKEFFRSSETISDIRIKFLERAISNREAVEESNVRLLPVNSCHV